MVASILGVLLIAMIGLIVYYERPQPGPQAVAGVPCDRLEHSQVHYHAALQIVYNGNVVNLRFLLLLAARPRVEQECDPH